MTFRSKACYTCKKRRIKCDLRKPGCRRCSTYGVPCPGYLIHSEGIRGFIVYHTASAHQEMNSPISIIHADLSPSISLSGPMTKFLDSRVHVSKLWETIPDTTFGADGLSWKSTVFHLSNERPILQHLLAAISCMYEAFGSVKGTDEALSQACEKRSLALSHARRALKRLCCLCEERDDLFAIILSGSLFVALEYLGTYCHEGHMHLKRVYSLYAEYQRNAEALHTLPAEKKVVDGFVGPMMLRWGQSCRDLATIFQGEIDGPHSPSSDLLAQASRFGSIAEARQSLEVLVANGFKSLRSCKSTTLDHQLVGSAFQFRSRVLIWISKLNGSFNLQEPCTGSEYNTSNIDLEAILLRIRAREVSILACTVPFQDEMLFDKYTADFRNMLHDCKQFIAMVEEQGFEGLCGDSFRLKFSVDFKVLPPLWLISSRCREPGLRKEALLLLARARRREAEWSSVFAAVVLSKLQIIEKECSEAARGAETLAPAEMVPLTARIRATQIMYNPNGGLMCSERCRNPTLAIKYVKAPFEDLVGPFEERHFELTLDDLTEYESMLLCSSTYPKDSMLAKSRARWISDMYKHHQQPWTSWLYTSGRYDAFWKITPYYNLDHDWSMPLIGSISY